MHRIDGAGHVNNRFVDEDPFTLRPPTEITPEIMNAFQEELASIIEWAGIPLAKGDNTQLRQALLAKFATINKLGSYAGVTAYSAATVLTEADIGKIVRFGSSGYTVTLPNTESLAFGSALILMHTGTVGAITVAAADGNSISRSGDSAPSVILVGAGSTLYLVKQTATQWTAFGGSAQFGVAPELADALQKHAPITASAAGTADAITAIYTPKLGTLTNGMILYVRAAVANATTTPTFTPSSGTIAPKAIVKGAGAALAAGDIAGAGHWIALQYDATLDKWVLLNPATGISTASVASVQGAFKNLQASTTGLNTTVTVSADEIAVEDSSNTYKTLRNVSLSINSAGSGANGLDTGALSASTWYSVWAIHNPITQTTAGLLSLSTTAPMMPSGFTMKARVGWIRTDATGNKYPLSFTQFGRQVRYKVVAASNTAALPAMASGLAGSATTPTYSAVAVGNFVPPTASQIVVQCGGQASGNLLVAPNNSYGAAGQSSNPPPVMSGIAGLGVQASMPLESSNIYYASNLATGYLCCFGWEDNI